MKAVHYQGLRKVSVSESPKPKLHSPSDAILRVTTSGICGSDLHMYDGRTELEKGTIVGHEIMGVIDEVGDAVRSIKRGDRVVLPFNIACGFCFNCHRGYTNACLTMNPDAAGAGYGYAGMGPYQGSQTQQDHQPPYPHRSGAGGVLKIRSTGGRLYQSSDSI